MAARTILSASKTQMARGPVSLKVVGLDNHRRKVAGRSKAARNNHRLARPSHGRNSRPQVRPRNSAARLAKSCCDTETVGAVSAKAEHKSKRATIANLAGFTQGGFIAACLAPLVRVLVRTKAPQAVASAATARSGVIASIAAYHSGPAAALMAAIRAATAAAPASAGPKAAIAAFPVAVAVAASIST